MEELHGLTSYHFHFIRTVLLKARKFMETSGQACLVRNKIQTQKLLSVNHYMFGFNYQF
jgi:hypothetical protein